MFSFYNLYFLYKYYLHLHGEIFTFLANSYLSYLRRFRLFLAFDGIADSSSTTKQEKTAYRAYTRNKKLDVDVPNPSIEQVEIYLAKLALRTTTCILLSSLNLFHKFLSWDINTLSCPSTVYCLPSRFKTFLTHFLHNQ